MKSEARKTKGKILFAAVLLIAIACLVVSVIRTNIYNSEKHSATFAAPELFSAESAKAKEVTVVAVPRGSTWTKVFDLNNEGLTEDNFQAYTYDFTVSNNTEDEVSVFSFKLTFGQETFLSSAWNGALEIHQNVKGKEIVDTVPDLREFVPSDYKLKTVMSEGESMISMETGDYLNYIPSTSMNAIEMPIKPNEGTTPGMIMYIEIGKDLSASTIELEYSFNRLLTSDPLFWLAIVLFGLWVVGLVTYILTSAQIKKYNERHERDNEIIRESIETFTGFIDAKDPYTNGHSKRVAEYTKLIAAEFGYEGEELDRIYYVALLHDCGKIGVPDEILGKPESLTDEEYEVIKSHTTRGAEILSSFKSLENVGEGALYHHERYDGKGYPEGIAGEDIPFIARMICVADSFDVMNSVRVYGDRLSGERIISELEENKGTQFDPKVADVMLRLIRDGKIKVN